MKYSEVELASLEKMASNSNAEAQFFLAYKYEHQLNKPKKAFYWYKKSAEQGNSNAQAELGRIYLTGKYILQDYDQAYSYLKKGISSGNSVSKYYLGFMYYNGFGTKQDYNKAFPLCYEAALENCTLAFELTATMYLEGKGVKQNNEQAFYWF